MRRRPVFVLLLVAVSAAGALLDHRPPDWLYDDPLNHPFGLETTADSIGVRPLGPDAPESAKPAAPTPDNPLDLNRATENELLGLPGVGPVLAGRIVGLRDSIGAYRSPSDLLRVKGIGRHRLEDIRPLVRIREEKAP